VDRDPGLRRRLLKQFDDGAEALRGLLAERFGAAELDGIIATTRAEYARVIERLPWIGGSANPRSFSLYGSALWLALWRTLQPRGLTLEDARTLFVEIFRRYWARYPGVLRKLYGSVRMGPRNQRRTQRLSILSEERQNPQDYVQRFVPGEPGRFDFGIDFVECGIIKFLRAEGAEELAPVLCELDWPNAELIGVRLDRTTTLAQGGERCDFRFSRVGATDVGLQRASLVAVFAHAMAGWAACGAMMGLLLATVAVPTALVVHAIAAPMVFTAHLTTRYGRRPPVLVALVFTAVVMLLDAVIVAGVVQRSFAMFASVVGTWLPFALIFASTYATGTWLARARPQAMEARP
jgi:hypothetical protein